MFMGVGSELQRNITNHLQGAAPCAKLFYHGARGVASAGRFGADVGAKAIRLCQAQNIAGGVPAGIGLR